MSDRVSGALPKGAVNQRNLEKKHSLFYFSAMIFWAIISRNLCPWEPKRRDAPLDRSTLEWMRFLCCVHRNVHRNQR